jgi:hypothetical protein
VHVSVLYNGPTEDFKEGTSVEVFGIVSGYDQEAMNRFGANVTPPLIAAQLILKAGLFVPFAFGDCPSPSSS